MLSYFHRENSSTSCRSERRGWKCGVMVVSSLRRDRKTGVYIDFVRAGSELRGDKLHGSQELIVLASGFYGSAFLGGFGFQIEEGGGEYAFFANFDEYGG